MRRETFWNWACLSGEVQGQRVGLNLSCGVNETSFTENCFWLDGELLGGQCAFRVRSRSSIAAMDHPPSTTVRCRCVSRAKLHQERLDLGLLASNFKQLFGRFSGTLHAHGRTLRCTSRIRGGSSRISTPNGEAFPCDKMSLYGLD
jgi:hypothetical protein